jgi:SUN domain-containing protein 1/2
VLNIATKNTTLLVALLYLSDLAWHCPLACVNEVESSLTRTFRMIQVLLEVVCIGWGDKG